jgi:hypothetical protein
LRHGILAKDLTEGISMVTTPVILIAICGVTACPPEENLG